MSLDTLMSTITNMLSDIEIRIVSTFANVTGIPADMLKKKLATNKEENVYPFWLFNSKPVEGNVVTLSPMEQVMCRHVGPMRTQAARENNLTNMRQVDSEKEQFIEVNGLAAEVAYGKKFNLYPKDQLLVKARRAAEDAGDYLHNDEVVDVKVTEYATGRLTYSNWKKQDIVKVCCLFTGDYRKSWDFTFRGWMRLDDLCVESRLGFLPGRSKQQYIAEQKDLVLEFPRGVDVTEYEQTEEESGEFEPGF